VKEGSKGAMEWKYIKVGGVYKEMLVQPQYTGNSTQQRMEEVS